ncbi:MAG: hypothetical protein R3F62_22365 [Planctomycetota bacterium]
MTLRPEAHVRHNGFLALARSPYAPGRAPILVRALGDGDAQIRKESASWLLPDADRPLELGASSIAVILSHLAVPEAPGHAPSEEVLSRLTHPQLVPLLIVCLEHASPAVRGQAGTRLQEISGQAVVYDPELEPRVTRRAFAVWWWKRTHPDGSLEGLLRDLGAENPSLRWRSAKEARSLPLPEVRDRVAQVLAKERAAWVQDEQLRALEALLELDLELPQRLDARARAEAVERALEAWARARVQEAQRRNR